MEKLTDLYRQLKGEPPVAVDKLPVAGSNRSYFRMTGSDGQTVIGVIGTSRDEDQAFIYLAQHFTKRQLPVPRILAVSDDKLRYIQSDLGNLSLYDAIKGGREAGGRYNKKERELLINTIRELPNIQMRGARGLDWTNCYPQPEFNTESVLFDLNYFKYCFLKPSELDFHELKLDAYFIDFQGGRKGPYYYDLASFLWQASAQYSYKLRRDLIAEYYNSLKNYGEVPSVRHFANRLSLFVLFRTLQVLGAYGFRGYFERKQYFVDSIPRAMDNLRDLLQLDSNIFPYPYMMDMLRRLTELPQFAHIDEPVSMRADGYKVTDRPIYQAHPQDGPATFSKYDGKGPLVVRVYSFSYRKGIPEDPSGNGGGYVFDCRSTHNPGRYEPYKQLTGLDEPVIRFLEDDGEILTFLDSVYRLADHHVNRYIQRGFTSLVFAFGCTGGQHRSVYCAQHLGEHLHEKFGIEVHITHREQRIEQVLPPKESALGPADGQSGGLTI